MSDGIIWRAAETFDKTNIFMCNDAYNNEWNAVDASSTLSLSWTHLLQSVSRYLHSTGCSNNRPGQRGDPNAAGTVRGCIFHIHQRQHIEVSIAVQFFLCRIQPNKSISIRQILNEIQTDRFSCIFEQIEFVVSFRCHRWGAQQVDRVSGAASAGGKRWHDE